MDPIADFLTLIRNGYLNKAQKVISPNSKIKREICKILKERDYIYSFGVKSEGKFKKIEVELNYANNQPSITHLKRISKPSLRIYRRWQDLRGVLDGSGIAIVSTSQGLMTDKEARKRRLGGEVIGEVW